MNEFLDFISISVPTVLISIINLLILFLILKNFLFKPVQKVLLVREEEVGNMYSKAEEELSAGEQMSTYYKEKLNGIEEERRELIAVAVEEADKQCEKMYINAQEDIVRLKKESDREIALNKEIAYKEAKEEIADISVAIAEHILQREIDIDKHTDIVEKFVNSLEVTI